jgi:hypothetical protein
VSRPPVKRQRERRAKPEKRQRLPLRDARATVHYLHPEPGMPHVVQLFLSPTQQHMHATVFQKDGEWSACPRTAGMVRHYTSKVTGRYVVRPGHIIARMFLNAVDLRRNGMEIISHECTHAGMAWARLRRANLRQMPGEEVLCYATGRMARQVNRIGQIHRIWG